MRSVSVVTLSLLVAVASAGVASAQPVTQTDSVGRVKRVVDSLASVVRTRYVDADTGARIAAVLLDRLAKGAYDGTPSLDSLSRVLTRDLRQLNEDRHLAVASASALSGLGVGGPASGTGAPLPPVDSAVVLAGNVGYIALARIPAPSPAAVDAIAAAMASVQGVDALIIDLRGNRGGVAPMVDTLWSYLVGGSDTVRTLQTRGRTGPTTQRWVVPTARPRPNPTIPLFILTSGSTGSAAEGFAYFLQKSGRATVVGGRTGGAGHMAAPFPLGDGLVAIVSIRRVWFGNDTGGWERVGVTPNVQVPAAFARDSAHAIALRRLGRPPPAPPRQR